MKIDFKLVCDFRFYNHDEINEDVLIVRDKSDRFHAIDAKCSHEGNFNLVIKKMHYNDGCN